MIKLGGHDTHPYKAVSESTGEDFGSFDSKKPVKLAIMLGLIDILDTNGPVDCDERQKKIARQSAEAAPLDERREIFAFVCKNEARVRHLLVAPDANLLLAQSRAYVMESRLEADKFESVTVG